MTRNESGDNTKAADERTTESPLVVPETCQGLIEVRLPGLESKLLLVMVTAPTESERSVKQNVRSVFIR